LADSFAMKSAVAAIRSLDGGLRVGVIAQFPSGSLNLEGDRTAHPPNNEMAGKNQPRQRDGETFWRAHHEAWQRSDLIEGLRQLASEVQS